MIWHWRAGAGARSLREMSSWRIRGPDPNCVCHGSRIGQVAAWAQGGLVWCKWMPDLVDSGRNWLCAQLRSVGRPAHPAGLVRNGGAMLKVLAGHESLSSLSRPVRCSPEDSNCARADFRGAPTSAFWAPIRVQLHLADPANSTPYTLYCITTYACRILLLSSMPLLSVASERLVCLHSNSASSSLFVIGHYSGASENAECVLAN